MRPIGSTPLGQTSTHCIHRVQSQTPPYSSSAPSREVSAVVTRIADEAVRLGERGRPQKAIVHFEYGAIRDARAAHDAGHDAGQVLHVFGGRDVLGLRLGAVRLEPGLHGAYLAPERGEVDYEVFLYFEVSGRLDHDRPAVFGYGVDQQRVARQTGLAVDSHGAGAAYSTAARTTEGESPVELFADAYQAIEHSVGLGHLQLVLLVAGYWAIRPSRGRIF